MHGLYKSNYEPHTEHGGLLGFYPSIVPTQAALFDDRTIYGSLENIPVTFRTLALLEQHLPLLAARSGDNVRP
jgi:hypothetical protein